MLETNVVNSKYVHLYGDLSITKCTYPNTGCLEVYRIDSKQDPIIIYLSLDDKPNHLLGPLALPTRLRSIYKSATAPQTRPRTAYLGSRYFHLPLGSLFPITGHISLTDAVRFNRRPNRFVLLSRLLLSIAVELMAGTADFVDFMSASR